MSMHVSQQKTSFTGWKQIKKLPEEVKFCDISVGMNKCETLYKKGEDLFKKSETSAPTSLSYPPPGCYDRVEYFIKTHPIKNFLKMIF